MKETNLEKLAEKYARTREKIAKLLTEELEVDEDVASIVAMEVVRGGVGNEQIAKVNKKKKIEAVRSILLVL